jgi:DNA-directed RNA polymerase II subunit RPB2
MAKTGKLAKPR